jgi:hypothetical protein
MTPKVLAIGILLILDCFCYFVTGWSVARGARTRRYRKRQATTKKTAMRWAKMELSHGRVGGCPAGYPCLSSKVFMKSTSASTAASGVGL